MISVINIECDESRERYLAYVDTSMTLGLMFGAIFGSIIYMVTDDPRYIFIIMGALVLFSMIIGIIIIPKKPAQGEAESMK